MRYASTKTYGPEVGLSCAFRQWRADSHCSNIHGYAITVKLVFEADELNENNWVMDFGGLGAVKTMLTEMFDHTLLVAEDDPHIEIFNMLDTVGVATVIHVPATGCEAFAELIYVQVSTWMGAMGHWPRVRLVFVEVREHGANSAVYRGEH